MDLYFICLGCFGLFVVVCFPSFLVFRVSVSLGGLTVLSAECALSLGREEKQSRKGKEREGKRKEEILLYDERQVREENRARRTDDVACGWPRRVALRLRWPHSNPSRWCQTHETPRETHRERRGEATDAGEERHACIVCLTFCHFFLFVLFFLCSSPPASSSSSATRQPIRIVIPTTHTGTSPHLTSPARVSL